MIVAEHLAAVLECQILGVPPPVISWTFNGQPIQNTFGRFILSNGSLYFAAPVNRSYAGQYVCSGTNSVSSVSSGAILFRVACKYYHLQVGFICGQLNNKSLEMLKGTLNK